MTSMRLVLLYNSISGNGQAASAVNNLQQRLKRRGHKAELVQAANGSTSKVLSGPLTEADVLVVVGGDGTMQSAADAAIRASVPVYHVPMGTENLFAREFGMNRDADRLDRALAGGRVVEVDVGNCNGRTFLLMSSVGPDASVIHRLARLRRGPISHLSYLRPILEETLRPAIAPLTVTVDGETVVEERPGLLVVANSRQYAMRVDPAEDASMSDGLLDVVFFPSGGVLSVLGWALSSRLRRHRKSGNLIYIRGRDIQIRSGKRPVPVQIDGEAAGFTTVAGEPTGERNSQNPVQISMQEKRLRVLVP